MITETDRAIIEWVGRLGAVTAEDTAARFGLGQRSAERRLAGCRRAGLLERHRLLVDSSRGLRFAGLERLGRCRVSVATFAHWRECARVAVFLEAQHPGRVMSDRELRAAEREQGRRIASAELGMLPTGEPGSHHPDLVLWSPEDAAPVDGVPVDGVPVAIEVELAVKAPRRLEAICRAWGRNRRIGGVVYYAAPRARRAVTRAIAAMHAESIISVVPLEAAGEGESTATVTRTTSGESTATEPSQARPSLGAAHNRPQPEENRCPPATSTVW
jgi:hypothetical protein